MEYLHRIADKILNNRLAAFGAVLIEGRAVAVARTGFTDGYYRRPDSLYPC